MNGIIKHNLRSIPYPSVSINLHDLHAYAETLKAFNAHINDKPPQEDEKQAKSVLKEFFKFEDKFVWLTPFSYSA